MYQEWLRHLIRGQCLRGEGQAGARLWMALSSKMKDQYLILEAMKCIILTPILTFIVQQAR